MHQDAPTTPPMRSGPFGSWARQSPQRTGPHWSGPCSRGEPPCTSASCAESRGFLDRQMGHCRQAPSASGITIRIAQPDQHQFPDAVQRYPRPVPESQAASAERFETTNRSLPLRVRGIESTCSISNVRSSPTRLTISRVRASSSARPYPSAVTIQIVTWPG